MNGQATTKPKPMRSWLADHLNEMTEREQAGMEQLDAIASRLEALGDQFLGNAPKTAGEVGPPTPDHDDTIFGMAAHASRQLSEMTEKRNAACHQINDALRRLEDCVAGGMSADPRTATG